MVSFTRRHVFLVGQSHRCALNSSLPGALHPTRPLCIKAGLLRSQVTKFWTVAPTI